MEAEVADQNMLIPEDVYLTSGVHIGTQQKSADMKDFIFKVRNDGLYVLDVKQTDKRLHMAINFLLKYEPSRILVVSARQYGQRPVREFAKAIGAKFFAGRFVPGTLTNPKQPIFVEPDVIMVADPSADQQALREAVNIGIPVVGLCDANNETRFVDLVIPANNKGRMSLATIYWIAAREILKGRGVIKSDDEFTQDVSDFEAIL